MLYEITAKEAVEDALKVLYDHKGFNWWWDGLDEETKIEIKYDVYDAILGAFVEAELDET